MRAVGPVEVELAVKSLLVLFTVNVVAQGDERRVDDISPEPPDHAGVARPLLLALDVGAHCSVRLCALGESELVGLAGQSESLVLVDVDHFCEVLDAKGVLPIH